MTLQEKISIAIQIITLVGIVFSVYLYIRKPQEKSEISDAVFEEKMKWVLEKFDTRFQDMKDGVVKIMQNDLQEIKRGLENHVTNQGLYERDMAEKYGRFDAKLDTLLKK